MPTLDWSSFSLFGGVSQYLKYEYGIRGELFKLVTVFLKRTFTELDQYFVYWSYLRLKVLDLKLFGTLSDESFLSALCSVHYQSNSTPLVYQPFKFPCSHPSLKS